MNENLFKKVTRIGKAISLATILSGGALAIYGESLPEYKRGIIDSPYETVGAGLLATGAVLPLAGMAYISYRYRASRKE